MSHLTKRLLGVSLLVVLTGATQAHVFAQGDEQTAIRNLVQQFFAAYVKEDIEGLMSLWSERPDLQTQKQDFLKTFQDHQNLEVKNLDIGKITIEVMATPRNNIGSTYRVLGNNAQALEYYQKSLELSEASKDKRKIAFVLSNISQQASA